MSRRSRRKKKDNNNGELLTDVTQKSSVDVIKQKPRLSSASPKSHKNGETKMPVAKSPGQLDDDFGEPLGGFVEEEWDSSAPAYNPELINVKTEANKISVFKAKTMIKTQPLLEELSPPRVISPERMSIVTCVSPNGAVSVKTSNNNSPTVKSSNGKLTTPVTLTEKTASSKSPRQPDKADEIGELVAQIVRLFLKNKNEEYMQISVDLLHSPQLTHRNTRSSNSMRSRHSNLLDSSKSYRSLITRDFNIMSPTETPSFIAKDSTTSRTLKPVKSWTNFSLGSSVPSMISSRSLISSSSSFEAISPASSMKSNSGSEIGAKSSDQNGNIKNDSKIEPEDLSQK